MIEYDLWTEEVEKNEKIVRESKPTEREKHNGKQIIMINKKIGIIFVKGI